MGQVIHQKRKPKHTQPNTTLLATSHPNKALKVTTIASIMDKSHIKVNVRILTAFIILYNYLQPFYLLIIFIKYSESDILKVEF